MEHGVEYQNRLRAAIRAVPEPPHPVLPFDSASVFPLHHRQGYRIPHSNRHVVNGDVVPPKSVSDEIDSIWGNMYQPNRDSRIKKVKRQVPVAFKQELYRLWWVSADLCNLSGVKGNWTPNSPFKLCFDEIRPKSKGGDYSIGNLQVILTCVNTAKWDYENQETKEWMAGYKRA